ncbi:MAG: hypothetical protein HOP35_02080 [Nitrospira sp.]|nr:hypothetical protein [Nitrospira sp.]
MPNCSDDVLAFHDDEVTLPQAQRNAMKDRRNANRDRLKDHLNRDGKPMPYVFVKQGSYAMLTMVQDPDNDYDIDDGVYFTQASLKRKDGTEMSPTEVKQMVCTALQDDRFETKPQVKRSCVRIYYQGGYHVDMPVYRIRTSDGQYELADDNGWTVSRAADVEDWFDQENEKSPDRNNGWQFRRLVRCLKKFARSRKEWKDQIASGFIITKLAADWYVPNKDREDLALRDTIRKIYNRLCVSPQVYHPITNNLEITKGPADSTTTFLRDKLRQALVDLAVLDSVTCTRKQALAAWDKVFGTDYFSKRLDVLAAKSAPPLPNRAGAETLLRPAAVASGLTFPNRPVVPNKPAGFA